MNGLLKQEEIEQNGWKYMKIHENEGKSITKAEVKLPNNKRPKKVIPCPKFSITLKISWKKAL
jgi:hypothetical protein